MTYAAVLDSCRAKSIELIYDDEMIHALGEIFSAVDSVEGARACLAATPRIREIQVARWMDRAGYDADDGEAVAAYAKMAFYASRAVIDSHVNQLRKDAAWFAALARKSVA